jgi:ABC-type Fe3+/spermidine/putrescine transport system ATPase subunit
MSEVLLSVRDLRVRRGPRWVLDGLTLELGTSEVLAVMGPSGSGKSTLVQAVLGLLAPDAGSIVLQGRVLAEDGCNRVQPFDRALAVVFQDLALWPHLTVRNHLAFGLRARGVPLPEQQERIESMLRRVGLGGLQARHPDQLSGGERQRVAIARALVLQPALVLLDEPLSNLDAGLKRELLALFRELLVEQRSAALFITHDAREVAFLGHQVAVIDAGRIVQQGTLATLSEEPRSATVRSLLADLPPFAREVPP